jgi:hypothetical protein
MTANIKKVSVLAAVAAAVAMALAIAPAFVTSASAKITSETTDTSCTNGGGNEPGGQQPSCTGGGLTQNTETTNVNPSGSAPPGQNK